MNDLTALADRLADAQARRDRLVGPIDEEINGLKAAIRGALDEQGPGTYPAGDRTVTVRPNRRFDPMVALRVVPQAHLASITTTTVDSTLAKKKLPPEVYEACMTERGQSVVTLR